MFPSPQINNISRTVVAVDDFLANPDETREFALAQEFREDLRYYRGKRTPQRFLSPGLKEAFESLLGLKITKWEEHGTNGVFQYCVGGDQIVYHSDAQKYAGVLFLTPNAPPSTGTTMVRSAWNKSRSVDEALRNGKLAPEHAQSVAKAMYGGKLLDPTAWEPVDTIGNVYNRLVLWDARMAHHASNYFGDTKENGRLFQLFFFD